MFKPPPPFGQHPGETLITIISLKTNKRLELVISVSNVRRYFFIYFQEVGYKSIGSVGS